MALNKLISGSFDQTVKVWSIDPPQLLLPLTGHTGYVWSVCCDPSCSRIVSASSDKTIKIWNSASGDCIATLTTPSSVSCVCFSSDGKYILSGGADKLMRMWDGDSYELLHSLAGHTNSVKYVAINPSISCIASASNDSTIRIWDDSDF